ncbi:hypothetical protein GEMRC1_001353 [Eukaryota sp. GEM-RC1]
MILETIILTLLAGNLELIFSIMSFPNPCFQSNGSFRGYYYPFDPRFTEITEGESITVTFSKGMAYFKPSTCITTFSIAIPKGYVFGMYIRGASHEWKVERASFPSE